MTEWFAALVALAKFAGAIALGLAVLVGPSLFIWWQDTRWEPDE